MIRTKKIIILIVIVVFSYSSYSQKYTISGTITDSLTGEKIINATIFEKISKRNTTTNSFGFYSLSIPNQDSVILFVSNFGYNNYTETITSSENLQKNIRLTPTINYLQKITITSSYLSNTTTSLTLSPKQISLIPALGGEKDLLKAFQLMPGIMQGTEGKSGIYVRGGSSDQNLIILDDVPLYSIEHFGGFFSVFNDDAINSVKLYKGGFPARFGGRLSSVIDVRMKDGNMKKFTGTVSLGILTGKILLEGPIIEDKISFMFSFRRSMIDLLLTPYYAIDGAHYLNYVFYDLNSKINYKVSKKDNVYLSFYSGDDKLTTKFPDFGGVTKYNVSNKMRGGNFLTSLRWNHIYGNKLFGNLTTSYTKFRYLATNDIKEKENNSVIYSSHNGVNSSIMDFSIKYDLEYSAFNFYKVNIGTNFTKHIFNPAKIRFSEFIIDSSTDMDTTLLSQKINSNEFFFYIENTIKLSNFLTANVGLRDNIYTVNDKKFISYEPRVVINLTPTKNISFRVSYAEISQNIHLMSFDDNVFFTSIWMPATEDCPPEKAKHYAFAIETFIFKKFNVGTEIYYKKMNNLIEFAGGSFWNNASSWEEKSQKNGVGESYGFEFFVNKKIGKLTGWLSYSYSKTTRQFENINSGNIYPYDFDRPHDFKIFASYQIKENLNISATWIVQSGRPVNLPIGYYYSNSSHSFDFENNVPIFDEYYTELFSEKNSMRMKPYHRLDLSLNWTKEKKRGTRTWNFSIYNAYNRLNPYYYYFDFIENENGEKERKLYQYSMFPFIPSINYTFKF